MFLSVYNLAQTNGTSPSLGSHMCLLGDGLLILRGMLNFILKQINGF
jgi:hypothetical protein